MIIEEALKSLHENSNEQPNINLKKKSDITEPTPGDTQFKQLLDNSSFDKGVKVTTGKYLSEDDSVVFTITATKDFLSDLSDDFELEEETDVDYDTDRGYYASGGYYAISNEPDVETLSELLYEAVSLDDSYFAGHNDDSGFVDIDGFALDDEDTLLIVGSDFDTNVDIEVEVSGSYYPATYWEPAEYPDVNYTGECSATVTLYFIFRPAFEDEDFTEAEDNN